MKKLIFILFLIPVCSFSQSVVGTWAKNKQAPDAIVLRADSTLDMVDRETGKSNLRNISIKYSLTETSGEKYMEYLIYNKENKLTGTKKFRYKLNGNRLYMPRTTQMNGVEQTEEFKDIYTRIK
jgi:hypothetical protein